MGTTHLGGFQYNGKVLLFFPTAEGYVNYTAPVISPDIGGTGIPESFNYVFNYTDHLGNIRVSYGIDPSAQTLKIIEENHYYPFGLKHTKYNTDWNQFGRVDGNIGLRPGRPVAPLEYKYKYNGKEFQDELGLNTYDYGFRQYMSDIGRFGNIDMLAELAYDLTPNRYCFNNPMRFTDPTGLWEQTAGGYTTNKKEDIERFMSYMDFEKNALNNSPTNSQTSAFIDGEMSSGGHGKTSDGNILADAIKVTSHKQIGGGFRLIANEGSFSNFWHGVQKSLTPDALDTRTLNKQFGGVLGDLSYPGPSNPKTYSGKDDFSYMPRNLEEFPAIAHDLAYDRLKIKGSDGLFTARRAIRADYTFVVQELAIALSPANSSLTRLRAGILGVGLGLAALPKTINAAYWEVHDTTK